MAALTPAQIELANSLSQDVPTKLRCAVCSKLAINAFRLPCCETAICENCQSTLPSSCPVCEHSPVSGDDCTIYKSLRTTIRVFLKTEEKKREAARPKSNVSAPPTPVEAIPISIPTAEKGSTEPSSADITTPLRDEAVDGTPEQPPPISEAQQDVTIQPERESGSPPGQENADVDQVVGTDTVDDQAQELVYGEQVDGEGQHLDADYQDHETGDGKDAEDQSGPGYGQDSMNGNFNGMNFGGGDMNQMQMLMAMQNGMNPAAFGSFPMMGMGMGVDPVAMQSMYMNGGFGAQGMGMNGMNMGMNSYNGGNNDWSGQQSWNFGQDNFNPNATGMGNGDFGNFNSGIRAGYNSGNYGHNNQFNDYGRGGYGFRGRGRGRGFYRGYGRGYNPNQGIPRQYGQQMWAQESTHNSGDSPAQLEGPHVSEDQGEGKSATKIDEFGRTVRPGTDQDGSVDQDGEREAQNGGNGDSIQESTGQVPTDNTAHPGEAHDTTVENGDVSFSDPYLRTRGPSYGTGPRPPPAAAPAVPLNAPTGPKAMRQGLPNTSALHLRARGLIQTQSPSITNTIKTASPIQEDRPVSRSSSRQSRKDADRRQSELGKDRELDVEQSRSKVHDKDHDRARSHSRSHSRSRSRDRKESRRHRRHPSESVSADDREEDSRRHRHKGRRSTRDDDAYKSRPKDDKHENRSRSASPERDREHRRSSHRSHRERDKDRDKDRESDREHRKKSSHRSHYDHEKERDRDRDRERDKERRKDRDRDREREREHRHRNHKTTTEPVKPLEASDKNFNPPTGPRGTASSKSTNSLSNEFSIKGASGKHSTQKHESVPPRRVSINTPKAVPNGPAKDPHTLERETRDRERLLKEAQRMAGLTGLAGLKRSRDLGDDRSGRRKSRRSEVVYGDEEERMRRLEAEREEGRWD